MTRFERIVIRASRGRAILRPICNHARPVVEPPLTMPQDPFYGSKPWREARSSQLRRAPHCCICERIGVQRRATEVDHIVPVARGGAPLHPSNLRSLCKTHHSQKTLVLDRPSVKTSRTKLVTTGGDGWPVHVEERYDGNTKIRTRKEDDT